MDFTQSVYRQCASLGRDSRSAVLSKLKESRPSNCEFLMERNGELIRYTSPKPVPVYHEIWLAAIEKFERDGDFGVVYQFVGGAEKHGLRLAVFSRGFCVLDEFESEVPEHVKADLSLYCFNEHLFVRGLSVTYVDFSDIDVEAYMTSNWLVKLAEKKTHIAYSFVVFLLLMLIVYLFNFVNQPEEVVIQDPNYIVVDDYREYKEYMASKYTVLGVGDALLNVLYLHNSVPDGWEIGEITTSSGSLKAQIAHRGGSVEAFDLWKLGLGDLGAWLSRDGQLAFVDHVYATSPQGASWAGYGDGAPKIASLDEARDSVLEVALALGGSVRSKVPVAGQVHSKQEVEVSFSEMGVITAVELLSHIEELPVLLNEVKIRLNGQGLDSQVVILLEVVGYE
ncbi:hypothetical protein ACP3V3_02120 [Vibrio sp. PNB22_3_1]